ncbi:transposase [Paenibacillus lignilyticus]|uniref:Transposase n=1 Tax=Paenibacillus lignilyticus TaxID=1172615 RepID=A0ABS5CKF7_9BACL|nr:transposase [Paenibacillus lignilyticus]MBP3966342.1 transposase [Paenibacillus lignilyticus]
MSEEKGHFQMDPMSGEPVEVDGVYKNEWGREEKLARGEVFPADPMLGATEWELTQLDMENHSNGETDPRLYPKKDATAHDAHLQHPKRHPAKPNKLE